MCRTLKFRTRSTSVAALDFVHTPRFISSLVLIDFRSRMLQSSRSCVFMKNVQKLLWVRVASFIVSGRFESTQKMNKGSNGKSTEQGTTRFRYPLYTLHGGPHSWRFHGLVQVQVLR